jgi:hypothetical protein
VGEALDAHLQAQALSDEGALFLSARGKLWRRSTFNEFVWKPSLRRAGLDEGYGFHSSRHAYASGLMDTHRHLFPDSDEATSSALDEIFGAVDPAGPPSQEPRAAGSHAQLRGVP